VLATFPKFEDYYQKLVSRHIRKAEVSRIIVRPIHEGVELRRHGLGEVIVDSLCTTAESKNVQMLFLACQRKHASFYSRCGFSPITGMECEKFGDFPVPAIAMERWFSPALKGEM